MYEVIYKEKTSTEHRILPIRRPDISAPEENVTEVYIPGHGVILQKDGTYKPIVIPIEFNFMDVPDKWGEVYRKAKKWISGSGKLKFSDDPEYFYRVNLCKIVDPERISRQIGIFTAEFTCNPYMYVVAGQTEKEIKDALKNPYELCEPIYRITGNGSCTLTVNGKTMKATVGQNLTIDTERMLAYRESDGKLMNTSVTGDYEDLYLNPGANTISVTSGFVLKVIPNWRCL